MRFFATDIFQTPSIRDKQIASGGEMRPPQGPKKKFDLDSEHDMAQYCEFGWECGIPKTKQRFSYRLVHYMHYYKIPNKFAKVVPGKGFFTGLLRYMYILLLRMQIMTILQLYFVALITRCTLKQYIVTTTSNVMK